MATQLSQDPRTEPDATQVAKLRAAAQHLTAAAEGRWSVEEGIYAAMILCGAVLKHEGAQTRASVR